MIDVKINIDKVEELLELADCSKLSKIEILSGGWANLNYLVTCNDETQIVLKIWREKTPDEVQELNSNIDWITKHGVTTPAPLKLKNGESMIIVDGFAWILLPFINAPWISQDNASLKSLGIAIAGLHKVPNQGHFGTDYSMGVDIWPELFERAESEDKWSPFLRMLEKEFIKIDEKIPLNLPKGVIHGDLFQDNILGNLGEVIAILDFEDICFNILAIDLVVAFIGCCWVDEKPVEDLWFSLLSGYESVRSLSLEEKTALPELYRYASLSVAAWRYRKFILDEENSENAGRYLLIMKRLEESVHFLTEIRGLKLNNPLEDDTIKLVQTEKIHFEEMYEVAKDPLLWEQHNKKERWQKDNFKRFFNKGLENENGCLTIIDKKSNEIIGCTRFYPHNQEHSIGYTFISREFWGTSINFQVKKLMLDYAYKFTDKIYFHVWANNFRSQKAVQKLGAEYFGNWEDEVEHSTYILKKENWNK